MNTKQIKGLDLVKASNGKVITKYRDIYRTYKVKGETIKQCIYKYNWEMEQWMLEHSYWVMKGIAKVKVVY